jgi:FKBP-type peptidyl-prolyl cis-trans isomerase FklB
MAEMDKLSYALGLSMGNNFQRSGVRQLNADDFAAALKAVYGEGEMLMTYDEAKQVVNDYFTQLEEDTRLANKKACEVFLQENAKRPEVKVT